MAKKAPKQTSSKQVETLTHDKAKRKNIPTAEYQSVLQKEEQSPVRTAYERRNRDLDPQLVWRGKDEQDWSDLVTYAPPLYIQEKVHPKVLIDDLLKQTREQRKQEAGAQPDLFADFNGIPAGIDKTEFYQHDQNWSNRMILGDSLQVMASLAEREGLRSKVQCIYLDPPYGIKFNSNFQWSTKSTKVNDGNREHISREPEQVKAFRDTWRDGIHSYLTYLRDRLTVDENVHRVRALMDEVLGENNFVSIISYKTSIGLGSEYIDNTCNYLIWYSKDHTALKCRPLFRLLEAGKEGASRYRTLRLPDLRERRVTDEELDERVDIPEGARLYRDQGLTSRSASATTLFEVQFEGKTYEPTTGGWRTSETGLERVIRADRVLRTGQNISYRKYFDDFKALSLDNFWSDVSGGITSRADPKIYVVQTATKIIERCVLMTTDPGDLVLDPTCGAGTTAYVAEQWGRRWITIDTSRVALALARARIMGCTLPVLRACRQPRRTTQRGGNHAGRTIEPANPCRPPAWVRVRTRVSYHLKIHRQ
jgi:adenine-specific DNA-methyltransferase